MCDYCNQFVFDSELLEWKLIGKKSCSKCHEKARKEEVRLLLNK